MTRGVFVRRKMPEPILPPDSAIRARFAELIAEADRVFFAGLPGVGKSLLLQQMALMAAESGRAVALLQWDVLRQPFETPRYPLQNGATHPLVIQAAGTWLRAALPTLDCDLLIGELPLVGGRLMELARRMDDAAEPILRDARTQFVIPAPLAGSPAPSSNRAASGPSPRPATKAKPMTPRPMSCARCGGICGSLAHDMELADAPTDDSYAPEVYAAVYLRLLRHRHATVLPVDALLPATESVYAHTDALPQVAATPAEAQKTLRHVEANPDARAWWDI